MCYPVFILWCVSNNKVLKLGGSTERSFVPLGTIFELRMDAAKEKICVLTGSLRKLSENLRRMLDAARVKQDGLGGKINKL